MINRIAHIYFGMKEELKNFNRFNKQLLKLDDVNILNNEAPIFGNFLIKHGTFSFILLSLCEINRKFVKKRKFPNNRMLIFL
jgi:hypothetical protein